MNKVELLGHAAIEYAAQEVVRERARNVELEAKLKAAQDELAAEISRNRWNDELRSEWDSKVRATDALLGRMKGDLKKIIDAPFWKRRGMLIDLHDEAYWIR